MLFPFIFVYRPSVMKHSHKYVKINMEEQYVRRNTFWTLEDLGHDVTAWIIFGVKIK